MEKTKIGIIGCGNIVGAYFQGCGMFPMLEIKACADIMPDRAEKVAKEYGCQAMTVDELLADPEIKIVINLTIPRVHAEVSLQVIEAGKSVHTEKPLAVAREDGKKVLQAAEANGVRVGCAPDTFLGAGIQTCAKLINDGWIGKPIAATAFMMGHGPEAWHPDPEFFYKVGGGPMFDMGPYYLTALITLLGPATRVSGSTRITFPERLITSQPKFGTKVAVETPTHLAGTVDFASGAVATVVMSFDVWAANLPCIEIYGTEGSMSVPDPNCFGGPVKIRRAGADGWTEMPLSHGYATQGRGIGVADMAYAMKSGRKHRANGEQGYHVLDLMHSFAESSNSGKHVILESTCIQPKPLPVGLVHGWLDD